MNTLNSQSWSDLCQRQTERAMAGDQQAARWCAEHQPAIDGARGWAEYRKLWDKFQHLRRSFDRLALNHKGYEKLYFKHWTEGCPEHLAWVRELQAAWSDPQAKADVHAAIATFDSWSEEQQLDLAESFGDFLCAVAQTHGLDATKLATEEQARRLVDAFPAGTFKETCVEIAAELAA